MPSSSNPIRESRTIKRHREMLQMEDALRVKKFNEGVRTETKDLYDNFLKNVSSNWNISFYSSSIKLRRNLVTDDNFHSAVQEILTYEDKHAKAFNLILSTPNEMVVSEIDDVNSKK